MAPKTSEDNFNDTNDDVHVNETEPVLDRTRDDETKCLIKECARTDGRAVNGLSSRKRESDQSNESENGTTDQEDEEADNTVPVDEHVAPDGGWGWFVVVGALILRMVIGGIGRSHGLFYIQFKERFNGTATSTALVTSLTCFVRLSSAPIVSILSGRFKSRALISFGTVLFFVGLILTGYGPNVHFLYFSYGVVAGFGRSFALTPVPILLGYYFNKRRSLAFGLASAGFSIGGFVITPIVELLFQNYGYQGTFLIMSGFALNILVSTALFRPIELHRKLTSPNRNSKNTDGSSEENPLPLQNLEQIESGADATPHNTLRNKTQNASMDSKQTNENETKMSNLTTKHTHSKYKNGTVGIPNGTIGENEEGKSDKEEPLLQNDNTDRDKSIEESEVASKNNSKWNCFKRTLRGSENKTKAKLMNLSILKDNRFQCFVFATFCFALPSSGLFLPALAKTKGVSELQAATLLSASAGCDTVFRVLSGIVLDLKVFRSIRPLIYNGIIFMQGIIAGLYPLLTNYSEFLALSMIDGAVQGVKNAQGTVVMMDLLGVDKLASSLAVTLAVQGIAVILGPTVSGQLIDSYGSYDGAFFFGSGAILLGGLVMAGGNIAKHCTDRKAKSTLDSDNTDHT